MKAIRAKLVLKIGVVFLAGALIWTVHAAESNSYLSIPERNPFGLKPPPPPEEAPPPPPPPAPPAATIKLTGITSMFSTPKALFEITEPGAGAKPRKPILSEGEKDGDLEVVSINVAKSEVTIRNSGTVTNITFAPIETAKAAPPAKAPPGRPVSAAARRAAAAKAAAARSAAARNAAARSGAANQGGPTIISRGGGTRNNSGGSVTVLGGAAGTAAATPAPPVPRTGATYNAAATAANRLRSIPTRTVRTTPTPNPTSSQTMKSSPPPMSKEQLRYWIEANRMVNPQLPWPGGAPSPPPAEGQ
jgi:hypothetical protein